MSKRSIFWKKIVIVLLTLCMMSAAVCRSIGQDVFAEEEDEEDVYEDIMKMADNPPADWYSTKDPYGYGLDNMFFLNQQQELLVYRYSGKSGHTINSYDRLAAENTGYPLDGAKSPVEYGVDQTHAMSYVQSVAFDPTGSGRKDHIAFIGVYADEFKNDKTKAHVYVYVMGKNNKCSSMLDLGHASWMSDQHDGDEDLNNDYMWEFNSKNFMGITAGDYDGDKKESLVVWACASDPVLKQVDVNVSGSSISLSMRGANGYSAATDWKDPSKEGKGLTHYLYMDTKDQVVENRLSVALGSGDFNGDGIDDLAVLSYLGRVTLGQQDRNGMCYIPMYTVSYGVDGTRKSIVEGEKADKNIGVQDNWDTNEHVAPFAAGMDIGDIDGDGRDEAVISGIYHKVTGKYWGNNGSRKEVDDAYDEVDASKLVTAVYRGSSRLMFDQSTSANNWTNGGTTSGGYFVDGGNGTASDQSYQQVGVKTVAINGKGRGKAELIFINGDLYAYNNGKMTCVFQPEYFKYADLGTSARSTEETYVRSVVAGNFDGNDQGREQIVFVLGLASKAVAGNVVYTMGMIGGIYQDDDGNQTPQAVSYYCTERDEIENTGNYYPAKNGGRCQINDAMNFELCAWDNDSDGLHVKYVGKDYIYTDPEVMAILQAPPYFEEVKGDMTGYGTTYEISTSYEYEVSEGNSTSFAIGPSYEAEGEVVKLNIEAQYATEWSETFSKGLMKSDTYSFTAVGEDQVVIYRTPITIYKYQVEVNNDWNDENILELSFPSTPVKAMMSVKDYNQFVDVYNEHSRQLADEVNADAGETVIKDEDVPKLTAVSDGYLGNEGDPYAYMSTSNRTDDVTVLQETPLSFTVGSSSTGFTWSEETSLTHEESMSHGFNFDFTLMFQWKVGHVGMALGAHASLEYMHESSTSETKSNGYGTSCEVGNIDPEALEDLGLTGISAKQYGFNYQLVSWPSNIKVTKKVVKEGKEFDEEGPDKYETKVFSIPIYGYMLSGVKSACPPVIDLDSAFKMDEDGGMNILLTWSDPSTENKRIGAYVIYQIQSDGSLSKIDTVDADQNEYLFTDIDGRQEYKFLVRTKASPQERYESINSNITYLFLEANALYAIELTSSDSTSDTYTVVHTNGSKTTITVRHGVGIVDIKKTESSEDGLYDTYTIYFSDGTTASYVVSNGKDGREIQLRTFQPEGSNKQIIQWRYEGDPEWNDLTEVSDLAAVQGRKVELRIENDYIQWHYEGEEKWRDLVPLEDLKGDKGDQGEQGDPGREIELRVNEEGVIQWHYVGTEEWKDLLASSDSQLIKGDPGREVQIRLDEEDKQIQWRYEDEEEWQPLVDLESLRGEDGEDGKQVQFKYDELANAILWCYEGEEWRELVMLETGVLNGEDGREIQLDVDEEEGFIRWRYEGESDWTDLISLEELRGEEGKAAREIELQFDPKKRAVMWRYEGDEEWSELFFVPNPADGRDGADGRGIVSVERTARSGIVDTYTIFYSDGTTSSFTVTNGSSEDSSTHIINNPIHRNDSYNTTNNNSNYNQYNSYSSSTDQNNNYYSSSPDQNSSEVTYTNVGISNIRVDSNGDLIMTLSDGSDVVIGSKQNEEASSQGFDGSGYLRSYYFDLPYEDFESVSIDGKKVGKGKFTVASLGDGILLTIRGDEIKGSSRRIEVAGKGNSVSAAVGGSSQASVPLWAMLLGGWNVALTAGLLLMAGRFGKLRKQMNS
ncbi:MAG: fibronectin type III domain-containing protein [Erysipelotrichaceae bacterium]|nr:fibronectin type III domain-containing protein [Erysipelotrichaceae bacterium]